MALRLRNIALSLHEDESELPAKAAFLLGVEEQNLLDFSIEKMSVDARKKPAVRRIYTVTFRLSAEEILLNKKLEDLETVIPVPLPEIIRRETRRHVLIAGMGPAGLFAALLLARSGMRVTLCERGEAVEQRVRAVSLFWQQGVLDTQSNVQFGEGGAGTFSDGKLTTRVNHPWNRFVLQTLVDFGAPQEILYQAKPHVGTDCLRSVLIHFRKALLQLGVDIRYQTCLTSLLVKQQRVVGAVLNGSCEQLADAVFLAPGHSARDTYAMLAASGVALQAKPFAMGVRVQHPAPLIDKIQYGREKHPCLPVADYRLAWNDGETKRGVYSFCMCPGGEVINASSEEGGVVVNGMSRFKRDSGYSNSALVVSVRCEDFSGQDALAGVRFQRHWEQAAFRAGGENYSVPAQNLITFLRGIQKPLRGICHPGILEADLKTVLPPFVVQGLRRALPVFDRKMKGFISEEALLMGNETRTSAPLRILRGEDGVSSSHAGLYPVGEGAGYAGGIVSAALDGLKSADLFLHT